MEMHKEAAQMLIALRAIPSASDQNTFDECAWSTTSWIAETNASICSSVTTSGGATFSTMKLFPHIWVRNP